MVIFLNSVDKQIFAVVRFFLSFGVGNESLNII